MLAPRVCSRAAGAAEWANPWVSTPVWHPQLLLSSKPLNPHRPPPVPTNPVTATAQLSLSRSWFLALLFRFCLSSSLFRSLFYSNRFRFLSLASPNMALRSVECDICSRITPSPPISWQASQTQTPEHIPLGAYGHPSSHLNLPVQTVCTCTSRSSSTTRDLGPSQRRDERMDK